jgi:D-alanyl-lipoteichoic acid acyltransferase DltB (MBOAT superfamily)
MVFSYILNARKKFAIYIGDQVGAPEEQIVIISTMAAVIPFSILNYCIKGKTNRLLYSLIIGFMFHISIYGYKSLHVIFSTLAVYYYCYFFGRKKSPFYVLLGSMLHLSILNIHRMFFDFGGWAIDDVSTIFMVNIAKYSSFAFSYEDGGKNPEEIKSLHLRKHRIIEMPSLLEFCSYIYFYPTCITGPFVEYKDFMNFIELTDCYTNLTSNLGFIFYQGFEKLFLGIFYIIFFALYGNKIPMYAVGKAEFREKYPKFWQRILYMYLCGPVGRAKYYVAWLLTYSSLIFSGMAYGETKDEKTGKIIKDVEKGSYGSIIYNEVGMNPAEKMRYWNTPIHLWLKYNVYIRVLISNTRFKNNKVVASFCTYGLSAIWHGFYPSYYVSFVMIYLFEQNGIFINEVGWFKIIQDNKILWPLAALHTSFFNNIIGSIFHCLEIGTTRQILINFKGLPVNAIVSFYAFSLLYRFVFMKDKTKKDKIKKEKGEKIRELSEKNEKETKAE